MGIKIIDDLETKLERGKPIKMKWLILEDEVHEWWNKLPLWCRVVGFVPGYGLYVSSNLKDDPDDDYDTPDYISHDSHNLNLTYFLPLDYVKENTRVNKEYIDFLQNEVLKTLVEGKIK